MGKSSDTPGADQQQKKQWGAESETKQNRTATKKRRPLAGPVEETYNEAMEC